MDRYRVDTIGAAGVAILARAESADASDPVRVSVEPPPRSAWSRILRVLGIGLWDLVKMPVAWLVGYLMGKLWK